MDKELLKVRNRINNEDRGIIDVLSERIKYRLNKEIYCHEGKKRFSYAFKKYWFYNDQHYFSQLNILLIPLLGHVCDKGLDTGCIDEVVELDYWLLSKVGERITSAANDIKWIKKRLGLPAYDKDMEERKHKELGYIAESKGIPKEGYHKFLQEIMDHTKRLQ